MKRISTYLLPLFVGGLLFFNFLITANANVLVHPCVLANSAAYAKYNKRRVDDMFTWLKGVTNTQKSVRLPDMMTYFTPNVRVKENGKLVAQGLNALRLYFLDLQKKVGYAQYSFREYVLGHTKIAVRYNVTETTRQGKKVRMRVIGIFSMLRNKIVAWNEVVSPK